MTATISIPTSDCEGLGSFFKTWATHSHIKHLDFHRIRDAKDRLLDLTTLTGMEEERRKEEDMENQQILLIIITHKKIG